MRLIDAEALEKAMYHEAFEKDSDMQKWDSGCWIRYKMFENAIAAAPTIDAKPISVIEDIKAEIKSICENTIYPPDDTFFREVVDEDYFLGLEYAIKIIDKHIGKE